MEEIEKYLMIIVRKQDEFNFTILRKKQKEWCMLILKEGDFIRFNSNENELNMVNGTLFKYWNEAGKEIIKSFENKFFDLNLLHKIDSTGDEDSEGIFNIISKLLIKRG